MQPVAGADTPLTICSRPERETQALTYSPGSLNNQCCHNFTIHLRVHLFVRKNLTSTWRRLNVRVAVCVCQRRYEKTGHLDRVKQIMLSPRGGGWWGGVAMTVTVRAGSSCADSWGELIHIPNAAGSFLLVLSALLTVLRPLRRLLPPSTIT